MPKLTPRLVLYLIAIGVAYLIFAEFTSKLHKQIIK